MALAYLHYDVFTSVALAGNQLAVFLDGRGVPAARMQAIAREMNFAESTFILPPEAPGTDVRMRIFTPFKEMPMAGHPTVGSTFALAHAGVIAPGANRFVFGLNVGPIVVDLEWEGDHLRFAWMTQLPPEFERPLDRPEIVAGALGLQPGDLHERLPVQVVSCGVPFLFVPIRDASTVDRASGDPTAFRRLAAATGVNVPVFIFAFTPPASVHSRMFAPELGIVEDPATGAASGPLGCYLVEHGLVTGAHKDAIVSRQGVAMGRPSLIHIGVAGEPGAIRTVRVGGQAVLVARGELLV
jgi:trans-2,3-dihydro-3-hydroxyanthranilate isomerase